MADFLADALRFLRVLWKESTVLLTGSGLAALLMLWSLTGHQRLPGNLAWFVVVLTFVYACFLVWRKEYREARAQIENSTSKTTGVEVGQGRIFVDQPIKFLVQPYEERTTIEADLLMQPYIGKWIRVTGDVHEVRKNSQGHSVFLRIDGTLIHLQFSPAWDEHVPILRRGQPINAVGKIADIDGLTLGLTDCEIRPIASEPSP